MLKGKQEEGSPAETTGRLAQTLGHLPTEGETSEKGVADRGSGRTRRFASRFALDVAE